MKQIKLFVGVPTMETVHAVFLDSMLGLQSQLMTKPLPNDMLISGWRILNVRGSILSKKREEICQEAIKGNFDYILFIDSDMKFPPDLFHRLLAHDKDCVAVNCAIKQIPSCPTGRKFNARGDGELVWPRDSQESRENPLEEVWMIGTGIMLVKTEVVRKIAPPRFPVTWSSKIKDYQGEDWNFVQKMRKNGVKVYIDHDVSWDVHHVGAYTYNYPMLFQQRQIEEFRKETDEMSCEVPSEAHG